MANGLITFSSLVSDLQQAAKEDKLNELLNTQPHESWLKKRPTGKGQGKYMPIEKIELLLTGIFQKWYVEVKMVQFIGNSVVVTITLHYWVPGFNDWRRTDGVGAAPLQGESGADATDASALKSAAVQMAAPMAKTYAIKDAAQSLGAIFGRDINRKGPAKFEGKYSSAYDKIREQEEGGETETRTEDTTAETVITTDF
jgi:hypothetical protein